MVAIADLPEFRREVAEFIESALPARLKGRPSALGAFDRYAVSGSDPETSAAIREWRGLLRAKGWLTPAWPAEHGGAGLTSAQQFVLNDELIKHSAPRLFDMGTAMIGPTLIFHGTAEQKERFLPGILEGEDDWCELFSEPGAGSDLASLQCRALRDGDEYVVNGQKIWTSGAGEADLGLLLARTAPEAPKHRGISMFVLDMHAPGVTVRPLVNLTGVSGEFNEIFLEDVHVPAKDMIGEENRGWYYVMTTLDVERSAVSQVAGIERTFQVMIDLARSPEFAPLPSPVRWELANRAIEVEVLRGLSRGVAAIQFRGNVPNHESAVLKLYHTELAVRLASTCMKLLGTRGMLYRGEERAPLSGMGPHEYLYAASRTIQVGTSEVQRNIIATRGLGLPRG